MSSKPLADIYAEQLLSAGYSWHGYPLWVEAPSLRDGRDVFLGDVGWFCEGRFTPLFNAMEAADHPINRNGVPRGFEPVSTTQGPIHVIRQGNNYHPIFWMTGSMTPKVVEARLNLQDEQHASTAANPGNSVTRRESACSPGPGAFVAATAPFIIREDSTTRHVRRYMRENMDSWLEFANTTLKLGLAEQDLLFVSRTAKTTRWIQAAFAGEDSRGQPDHSSSAQVQSAGNPFPMYQCEVERTDPAFAKGGWCLFIGFFKMKRRTTSTPSLDPALEHTVVHEDISRGNLEPRYDPVGLFLDYILEKSEAAFAVATDKEVTYLLARREKIPDLELSPKAIRWLSPTITIDENGVGTVDWELENWKIWWVFIGLGTFPYSKWLTLSNLTQGGPYSERGERKLAKGSVLGRVVERLAEYMLPIKGARQPN
uniref:Calcium dependent mitochondrial carrier protein n=1 Tax=Ganoderma boninense TaxID=34458 RepID=A0A5K1JV24_9APHY|nr:Calcium dependent mitochondrial carrier protein [Ganoderma boninense]